MNNTKQFAIDLHNEYQPSWDLNQTIEFVWRLQAKCIDNKSIRDWFEQSVQNRSGEDIPITVDSLPEHLGRTDWR